MHEFIKIFLQEFSIDCDMELKFDIISDDYRKSVAENKVRILREDPRINRLTLVAQFVTLIDGFQVMQEIIYSK